MAENVLDSDPPSAKRPKLSSPGPSASASDGNDCPLPDLSLDPELFVECMDCGRRMHQFGALHNDTIWPSGFVCDGCLKKTNKTRKETNTVPKGCSGGNGLPSPGPNNSASGPETPTSVGTHPSTPQTPTQGNMGLPQQEAVGLGAMGAQQHQVPQQGAPHPQHQQQQQMSQQQNRAMKQGPQGAGGNLPQAALQELLRMLRSPSPPLQQQQVLNILRSNPTLMAAFIKQRAARYQGVQGPAQGGAGGFPGPA